jgi:hypothetical protein
MKVKTKLYKLKDQFGEWLRWSQPTIIQKQILGMYTDAMDYEHTAVRLASEDSARYMLANMRTTPNYGTDFDLREALVPNIADKGLVLEFGVATGRSINHIARLLPDRTIHGFDSFEGLPEVWTSRFGEGYFAQPKPKVKDNVELHVGWFDATIPKFKNVHSGPIALLHIDGDLYSSAKIVLDSFKDQIVKGTVIMFDEYINYPGWQEHEFKAWKEAVKEYNFEYEYIGRVSRHNQVVVRIK